MLFIIKKIFISSSGNFFLSIYSLEGKLLKQSSVKNNEQHNISELENGVYILRVTGMDSDLHFTKKLYKTAQ